MKKHTHSNSIQEKKIHKNDRMEQRRREKFDFSSFFAIVKCSLHHEIGKLQYSSEWRKRKCYHVYHEMSIFRQTENG